MLGATLLILLLIQQYPTIVWLHLIPLTLLTVALAIGIGLILGILNVFFRDISQVMGVVLQLWFWFTPIVYPVSVLPVEIKNIISWNPMFKIVEAYHHIFVQNIAPEWISLWPHIIGAFLLLDFALVLFNRAAPEMADVL
jgi:lipopolysaccharide transport system permease protein